MSEPLEHGGGLLAAQRAFPDAPEPWLDLSTGINPVPYPLVELPLAAWTRLPEREEISGLEAIAAHAYGVGDAACVVAAPGAQSLIQLLPRLFPARTVSVLGPTYAEHAHRWWASGADVHDVKDVASLQNCDVAVVVNPNNPDGRIVDTRELQNLARSQGERNGLLIVDESFADVLPDRFGFAPLVRDHRAIVLRSFGKFYGLAGLRLGFAITSRDIADRIRDALGPWAVSGAAVAIGSAALRDAHWRQNARQRLERDMTRLTALLTKHGMKDCGGTLLFRLVAHADAERLHRHLCAHGILARAFRSQPTWLRFGLPEASDVAWSRLASALASTR